VSSPEGIVGAAAMITKNIKLTSAVTVLSSDDPVRVYQAFATVDQLSNGRVEIMAGRGSFIESFPLFGYDLEDYEGLFTDKIDLLLKINQTTKVSWKGKHRAPINNLGVYPRAFQNEIPIWLAAGGTPASAKRAAKLNIPLMLAIIGGMPDQFVRFIDLYKDSCLELGKDKSDIQLGVNNHFYVGEDSEIAANEFYPYYATMMDRVGRERGWQPLTKPQFDYLRQPRGALMVGSVQQVVDKILYEHEIFGNTRFLAQASVGFVPHDKVLKSIELFGTKVVPQIRKALN
jgi:probable LLM family oxidoreductase